MLRLVVMVVVGLVQMLLMAVERVVLVLVLALALKAMAGKLYPASGEA
jgi:hypothetical protein